MDPKGRPTVLAEMASKPVVLSLHSLVITEGLITPSLWCEKLPTEPKADCVGQVGGVIWYSVLTSSVSAQRFNHKTFFFSSAITMLLCY